MKPVLAGLAGLGTARLAALAGVGAATLGLLLFLAFRLTGGAPFALLYNGLDLKEASAMADVLEKSHIPHQISPDGATLLVPRDQVAQARLDLAKTGLPSGGSIGYEIFDRGDGLTASQFQQDINETRALEGELGRSIALLRGVRGVRVHLVLPRHEPFSQEQQQAQASVLLTLAGAARMDHEGIQSILNLVAAAVPGLKADNIAVIDNRGELLARAGQPNDGDLAVASQDELRRATETRLSHAVEEMLERSLGPGHVRAEASVAMNFDQTRETAEKYDPDGQVARSTQSVSDSSKATEKENAVTVQNNLPNPDNGTAASGNQSQRQEETTNYEIGKTTRTIVHDQPDIARITLAVMVDGTTETQPDGKSVWHERPAADLAHIATLARAVIGFDAHRGDTVDIVSMRFATPEAASAAPPGLIGTVLQSVDLNAMVQLGLLAAIVLIVIFTVLRPAVLRLAASPAARRAAGGEPDATRLAAGGTAPGGLLTDESMVNLDNVEGQIRASSIRRIAEVVDKHPAESLAIVRGWMAQEPA